MRDNFNKQLEDLYSSVKYMGSLCEKAIENASQTVVGDNADKIKEYAKNVNFYEKETKTSFHGEEMDCSARRCCSDSCSNLLLYCSSRNKHP